MGIRTDRQAATAVSADDRPVMVAAFWVDPPAQDPVTDLAFSVGNGLAGAVVGAFFTDLAEVNNARFSMIGVSN